MVTWRRTPLYGQYWDVPLDRALSEYRNLDTLDTNEPLSKSIKFPQNS